MFSLQNTQQTNSLSLDDFNPQAFCIMKVCGHRIVSIEQESLSKFRIKTECESGIKNYELKPCQGFMQFNITQTGIDLYLGKFDHHEECISKSTSQPGEMEDIKMFSEDFKQSWPQTINRAKSAARAIERQAAHDREMAVLRSKAYDDVVPSSANQSREAEIIVNGIHQLERQLKTFFKV